MERTDIYYATRKLFSEHGAIKVYKIENKYFMELENDLIYADHELSDYIWQINDKPFGNCLVLGLGLGTAAKYILSLNKVKSLTIVESQSDIIKTQAIVETIHDDRIKIINNEYIPYLFTNDSVFDFIFIDCYSHVNRHTLPFIADLVASSKRILSTNGILIGWMDIKTPEELIKSFYGLFTF